MCPTEKMEFVCYDFGVKNPFCDSVMSVEIILSLFYQNLGQSDMINFSHL
jgi:hypothetical protein